MVSFDRAPGRKLWGKDVWWAINPAIRAAAVRGAAATMCEVQGLHGVQGWSLLV
jgi:hypothetical protein